MRLLRLVPLAVIALVGCSKIHEKREFNVDSGAFHSLSITAPLSEQKVKVTMTSDQAVSVYVILEKETGGKDEIDPEKMKAGVLASQKNVKEATLDATIPAKEAYRVYVINASTKSAAVKVSIDSQ